MIKNIYMKAAGRATRDKFYAMQALSDAATLDDVVHLSVGQPGATPPLRIMDALKAQMDSQPLGYTESCGTGALREKIAAHYREQYGVDVNPKCVFVTMGCSAAYQLALLSAFDVGDRIAIAAPYYPATPTMMRTLGLEPIILRTRMADNYQPTLAHLQALEHKPDGLVIASPSNPAGTVIDPAELKKISDYCKEHNIRLISDEIYHGVSYGDAQTLTALALNDEAIITNSFSKYYLMPGWRLGWCIMPEALCDAAEAFLQNFYLSPPTLSQYLAVLMMDEREYLDGVVCGYDANRKLLLETLTELGFDKIAATQGAFYLYAQVSAFTDDSMAFCKQMLHEAKVCTVPGIDFDREEGHRFVRFSYAGSEDTIRRACERLRTWMASRKRAA